MVTRVTHCCGHLTEHTFTGTTERRLRAEMRLGAKPCPTCNAEAEAAAARVKPSVGVPAVEWLDTPDRARARLLAFMRTDQAALEFGVAERVGMMTEAGFYDGPAVRMGDGAQWARVRYDADRHEFYGVIVDADEGEGDALPCPDLPTVGAVVNAITADLRARAAEYLSL